jgi:hypothetical protein
MTLNNSDVDNWVIFLHNPGHMISSLSEMFSINKIWVSNSFMSANASTRHIMRIKLSLKEAQFLKEANSRCDSTRQVKVDLDSCIRKYF